MTTNLTKRQVQAEFEYVRRTFFPRWDRKGKWKLEVVDDDHGVQGRCMPEINTIRLVNPLPGLGLTVLIIHETAHAAASTYHGGKWQRRMQGAVDTAESLGLTELRAEIQKNIVAYRDSESPKFSAKIIYGHIKDVVVDAPDASFEEVMTHVRRMYGFSEGDFLKRFKRSRAVYDQSQKETKIFEEWREAFEASRTNQEKERAAYHEAGHAVIAYRFGKRWMECTIIPKRRHQEGSCSYWEGLDDLKTKEKILVSLAGYAAQKAHDPTDKSDPCLSDYRLVWRLSEGMNPKDI